MVNKYRCDVAIPALGDGYFLRANMNALAAIETEYSRVDNITGAKEYWVHIIDELLAGSSLAVLFVVAVCLRDANGEKVENFDWENADVITDELAEPCIDALSFGRYGKSYPDLVVEAAEHAKKSGGSDDKNPPQSPETGSSA